MLTSRRGDELLRCEEGGSGLSRAETLNVSPDFFGGCGDVEFFDETEVRVVGEGVEGERIGLLVFSRSYSSSPKSSTSTSTSMSSESSTSMSTSVSCRSAGSGESGHGDLEGEGLLVNDRPTSRPTPKDSLSENKLMEYI